MNTQDIRKIAQARTELNQRIKEMLVNELSLPIEPRQIDSDQPLFGRGLELESEVVEGFTVQRGFISPYMVTDPKRMEAVYDKPAVVVTDKKVSSAQEFVPLLEMIAQSGKKDLVLIADDVDGEALSLLVLNRLKGSFNTLAIKAPSDKDVLYDIAALVGAKVITDDTGMTFDNVGSDVIGSARKVIATKDVTTIVEGAGSKSEVQARVDQIDVQVEETSSDYTRNNLLKRQAALTGEVVVI